MKYYLAYGSNLNKEQMAWRCPTAKAVGTAEIKGYALLFKGSKTGAYLTIEKARGKSVPVAVWAVSEDDEQALDRYEGYPSFYYKKSLKTPVTMFTGEVKTLDTFVYIMHECRHAGIPSRFYVDVCERGYRDFGFDTDILTEAVDRTAEMMGVRVC